MKSKYHVTWMIMVPIGGQIVMLGRSYWLCTHCYTQPFKIPNPMATGRFGSKSLPLILTHGYKSVYQPMKVKCLSNYLWNEMQLQMLCFIDAKFKILLSCGL